MFDPHLPDYDAEESALSAELESPFMVRVMRADDLEALVDIDAKASGHPRRAYIEDKLTVCLHDPGINTSLVAEADGRAIGFLLGQLFFGEFGIPVTRAVLHTIGVHPRFAHQRVAHDLMTQYRKNMQGLRVESIHTLVGWEMIGLMGFFKSLGFRPSRDTDLVWDLKRFPFQGTPSNVEVGGATQTDLEAIAAIDQESMQATRGQYLADKLATANKRPQANRFLVARLNGEVAGFMVGSIFRGEFGIETVRGVIDSLAVREQHRHAGVASAMLETLLDWLREANADQIETLCRWNDWEVLRFFEYVGFRPSTRLNLEWRFN